jgi:hypothetical protein
VEKGGGMSEAIQIRQPDVKEFAGAITPIEARVAQLRIVDVESHAQAQEVLREIRDTEKRVEQAFAEPKKLAFQTHRSFTELEKKFLDPLAKARRSLNAKLTEFEEEQRRRAEEETRRREAEARKQEEERILNEAAAAEDAGDGELAQAILEAPVVPVAVVAEPEVAKVSGVSTREAWSAEVLDVLALAKHAIATNQPNLILPNQTALNQLAKALKENLRVPGVRPKRDIVRAVRT